MKYLTIKEASLRWGIDTSRIGRLVREGRIEGAKLSGRKWLIPEDAPKPADRRTKAARAQPREHLFRFPLFVNSEESFVPPLSPEEAMLCRAQKDFYACEFKRARAVFEALSEQAESIYVQISARFFMCVLASVYDPEIRWQYYYHGMKLLLAEDFPRKKEMALHLPWLDCYFALFGSVAEKFCMEPEYDCHPSALYMRGWMSILANISVDLSVVDTANTECFEVLCRLMEQGGHFMEAQELHILLFSVYYAMRNEKATLHHLRRVLHIAYAHDLLFRAADAASYYPAAFQAILPEFPNDFTRKLRRCAKQIFHSFTTFTAKNSLQIVYCSLSDTDYQFVNYALSGYSNQQVAKIMHISQRTVASRYNKIYDKLGVAGKSELTELINHTHKGEAE